jgi:hypothetical protein
MFSSHRRCEGYNGSRLDNISFMDARRKLTVGVHQNETVPVVSRLVHFTGFTGMHHRQSEDKLSEMEVTA